MYFFILDLNEIGLQNSVCIAIGFLIIIVINMKYPVGQGTLYSAGEV